VDPVTIGLIGSSLLGGLFGGGDEQQKRVSYGNNPFKGNGGLSPVEVLRSQLEAIKSLSNGIQSRPGVNLRSAVVQGRPAPVNIEGLPFQIGGGLGVDPALKDPSILQGQTPNIAPGMFAGSVEDPALKHRPGFTPKTSLRTPA
jgi:hypothetical protein